MTGNIYHIRKNGIVFLLFLLIMGCGTISPSLYPIPKGLEKPNEELNGQITFFVKPIITTGFSQEERREYKVDLSAHFTSFDVTVLNGTNFSVEIKPELFSLMQDDGTVISSLSVEESLDYFRKGDRLNNEVVRFISKPYRLIKGEREALKNLHLQGTNLKPGSELSGLIFFKKISPDNCKHIKLMVQNLKIHQTGESKSIEFYFSCQPSGFGKIGLQTK